MGVSTGDANSGSAPTHLSNLHNKTGRFARAVVHRLPPANAQQREGDRVHSLRRRVPGHSVDFDLNCSFKVEQPVISSGDVSRPLSGQGPREDVMRQHQNHSEMQRHVVAMNLMSDEATQIAVLIADLRKSVLHIDNVRACTNEASDFSLRRNLDARRKNLTGTIDVLQDRLSAIQDLIRLDRPHITHGTHRLSSFLSRKGAGDAAGPEPRISPSPGCRGRATWDEAVLAGPGNNYRRAG